MKKDGLLRNGIKDKSDFLPSGLIIVKVRWKERIDPHPSQDSGKPVAAADGQGQLPGLLFKQEQIIAILT